jgi:hypothetical protein
MCRSPRSADGSRPSFIESERDLVRLLVAPVSELAPFAHDQETALRQHTNRGGVLVRSASVKRTGCLHPDCLGIPRVLQQDGEITIFDLAKDKLSRALPHGR